MPERRPDCSCQRRQGHPRRSPEGFLRPCFPGEGAVLRAIFYLYLKRPVPPSLIGTAHRFLFCYKYGRGRISASLILFFALQAPAEPELFRGYADFDPFPSFPRNLFSPLSEDLTYRLIPPRAASFCLSFSYSCHSSFEAISLDM